ncbi:TPA: restriction endonuclease subunit S [Enterococcus faecium]
MSNDTQPEIRFPGFTEDWEERKLSNMTQYKNGKGNEDRQVESGKLELVNLNSISIDGGLKYSGKFVDEADETLMKDDLVMILSDVGHGDLLGRVALIPEDNRFVLNQRVALLRTNETANPKFLFSYINAHQYYFKSQGAGMSQLNISKGSVENFTGFVPSLSEQKQIGNFFKQLDDTIALQQRKLDLLKETKKGFLQKMFPENGAKVPEIRFPGFTEDWEQRKFKEFSKKTGKKNTKDLDFPAYSVSNKAGLISQTEQFDGSRLDDLEKTNYKFVEPNEFAYNPARVNVGSIAFNNLGMTVIVSSLYVVVKMSEDLDNEFILQFIKSPTFIKEVKRNTEGSVREYLFYENFANIKFPFTRNKEEQQKIGAFFKQLDDTIALHQRKLDLLKETKKGFLQKMFV